MGIRHLCEQRTRNTVYQIQTLASVYKSSHANSECAIPNDGLKAATCSKYLTYNIPIQKVVMIEIYTILITISLKNSKLQILLYLQR